MSFLRLYRRFGQRMPVWSVCGCGLSCDYQSSVSFAWHQYDWSLYMVQNLDRSGHVCEDWVFVHRSLCCIARIWRVNCPSTSEVRCMILDSGGHSFEALKIGSDVTHGYRSFASSCTFFKKEILWKINIESQPMTWQKEVISLGDLLAPAGTVLFPFLDPWEYCTRWLEMLSYMRICRLHP